MKAWLLILPIHTLSSLALKTERGTGSVLTDSMMTSYTSGLTKTLGPL